MSDEQNTPSSETPHEQPEETPQYRDIPQDELQRILEEHKKWVESDEKEGEQADLEKANLERISLKGAELRRANLRGAKLWRAKLQGVRLDSAILCKTYANLANFQGASMIEADLTGSTLLYSNFQNANLQDADLQTATGLLAGQFAGANVSGAKLPKDIHEFKGLEQVKEISQRCQKLFLFILLGCVYCWLTIATTTDVGLLTNSSSSSLPIIQTKIPIASFYWTAPLILLSLYFWFHLYLQRLWEWLATLPAVFPDGERLDRKVYPWLVSGLVSSHVPTLKRNRPPLSRLQTGISILLAWWLVPLTFVVFWLRYLVKHHWLGTLEHMGLIVITSVFAGWSYTLARKTLHSQRGPSINFKNSWKTLGLYKTLLLRSLKLGLGGLGALFLTAIVYAISDGAIEGMVPTQRNLAFDCFIGWAWDSMKEEEHTSDQMLPSLKEKAKKILTEEERLAEIIKGRGETNPGALRESTLEFLKSWYRLAMPIAFPCMGARAFADIKEQEVSTRPANWFLKPDKELSRMVKGAALNGADLRGVSAEGAFFMKADLRKADLREARLILANVERGLLQGANLQEAKLKGANLQKAHLTNVNLQAADLREANLWEASLGSYFGKTTNLTGTNLLGALNLTQAQLDAACSDGGTQLDPGFKPPPPCSKEKD